MSKQMKTYIVDNVTVPHLPPKHAASNGDTAKTVMIRTTSHEEAAKLLDCPVKQLRKQHRIREAAWLDGQYCLKDNVIYYQPGRTKNGYVEGWQELRHKA